MLGITNHWGNASQNTMKSYFTIIRVAIIQKKKKRENNKSWQGCGEIGIFMFLAGM